MRIKRSSEKSQKGQGLVEFAISVTFLLALLASVVDLGYIFFVYISLRDAVQEGAAYGAIRPADLAGIESRVRDFSNSPVDLEDASHIAVNVVIGPNPALACPGDSIEVTINYSGLPVLTPVLGMAIGDTIDLKASVTDTIIANPAVSTCP
jgi:hypothetical protein